MNMNDFQTNAVVPGIYTVWLEGECGRPATSSAITSRFPLRIQTDANHDGDYNDAGDVKVTRDFSLSNSVLDGSTGSLGGSIGPADPRLDDVGEHDEVGHGREAAGEPLHGTPSSVHWYPPGPLPALGIGSITFGSASGDADDKCGHPLEPPRSTPPGLAAGCYMFDIRASGTNGDGQPVTHLQTVRITVATVPSSGQYVDVIGFAVLPGRRHHLERHHRPRRLRHLGRPRRPESPPRAARAGSCRGPDVAITPIGAHPPWNSSIPTRTAADRRSTSGWGSSSRCSSPRPSTFALQANGLTGDRDVEMRPVVVAAVDIPARKAIEEADVVVRNVVADPTNEGAFAARAGAGPRPRGWDPGRERAARQRQHARLDDRGLDVLDPRARRGAGTRMAPTCGLSASRWPMRTPVAGLLVPGQGGSTSSSRCRSTLRWGQTAEGSAEAQAGELHRRSLRPRSPSSR